MHTLGSPDGKSGHFHQPDWVYRATSLLQRVTYFQMQARYSVLNAISKLAKPEDTVLSLRSPDSTLG
jgi:hypothetical protein